MIEIDHLTKRYGAFTAVDDVSFTARPGVVTGFLGPNGAGKSTAMRVMCGLTPASSGETRILGARYRDLTNPASQVGTLLDASAQHVGRTGREALTLAAIAIGAPRSRVDEMLSLVGLTPDESRRRLRNYSLGMRQRLGIAGALLGDPQVLILDEPANGLDPQGIHWMRGLLRGFADQGRTVLLSSHLLHEVEQTADEIIMIGRGRIVAQGSTRELLAGQGTVVASLDGARLAEALRRDGHAVTGAAGGELTVDADAETVGRVALEAQVVLTALRPAQGAGLEQMFLELTAGDARGTNGQEAAA